MSFASLALAASVLALALPASAQTTEIKIDGITDFSTIALQGGFVPNEIGAVVLDAQPGDYPITLDELRVYIAMNGGISPDNTMVGRFYVWDSSTVSGSNPNLGSAVYVSPDVVLTAGGFNSWDVSLDNIVLNGAFTVGCMIVSSSGFPGIFLTPSMATDTDGCQNGKNWVRQTNGVWANLCSFGVSGDLGIRVIAEPGGGGGGFIDLGNGLAGAFAPTLGGTGSTAPGANFTVELASMPPFTSGPLFVGFAAINANFKGGVLVPLPQITISLSTNFGSLSLPGQMPLAAPSGFSIFLQGWFPDGGGPAGADATNGLQMLVP